MLFSLQLLHKTKIILEQIDANNTKIEELKGVIFSMRNMMRQMNITISNMSNKTASLKSMNNSNNMVNGEKQIRYFKNVYKLKN